MTTKYEIRATEYKDLVALFQNLREQDHAELVATYGEEGLFGAVVNVWRTSYDHAHTGLANGEVLCVFGIKIPSLIGGRPQPWMLTTNLVLRNPKTFIKRSKRIIDYWSVTYPGMTNYVHAENSVAIRWLRRMGFELHEPETRGPVDGKFRKFEMRNA